jgi:hypothetical protein
MTGKRHGELLGELFVEEVLPQPAAALDQLLELNRRWIEHHRGHSRNIILRFQDQAFCPRERTRDRRQAGQRRSSKRSSPIAAAADSGTTIGAA